MEEFPIDAVVLWVDGNDPAIRAKRMKYITADQASDSEIGGEIRYTSVGEIKYCVASLLRFAPFLRKIFIVTDNQDPRLDAFLDRNFPDRTIPVEIVDHTVIFQGYEQYLPNFNCNSIETVIWRIPGLSERFIYLNDDFMLIAPTTPRDFFDGQGRAICYGGMYSVAKARFKRAVRPVRKSHKVSFMDTMLCAADLAGEKSMFPRHDHTPRPLLKSVYAEFFTAHPEALEANLRDKFRAFGQFNPQTLFYILGLRSDRAVVRPPRHDRYLKPKWYSSYLRQKLKRFDHYPDALFACFNSLELAPKEDIELCLNWIRDRLGVVG